MVAFVGQEARNTALFLASGASPARRRPGARADDGRFDGRALGRRLAGRRHGAGCGGERMPDVRARKPRARGRLSDVACYIYIYISNVFWGLPFQDGCWLFLLLSGFQSVSLFNLLVELVAGVEVR